MATMTRSTQEEASTVECRVGVRETLGGDGAVQRRLTIHCDYRREAVEMATCAGCEHFVGVRPRADGQPGVVLCRQSDGDPPPPADQRPYPLVGAVMERDIVCVRADVRVDTITALLLAWGASGVPVVDESGRPIGMISWTDLMRGNVDTAGLAAARRAVSDVMRPLAFAVDETVEFRRAAAVMSGEGIQQLPVLLGDGSVVGLLSTCAVAHRVTRAEQAPE